MAYTYSAITDTETDPGKPGTSSLFKRLVQNPLAAVQGVADGAPVLASAWHPYDAVTVGDGATGKFWDYSEDGGAETITTPTFEENFEYAIRFEDIDVGSSSFTGSGTLQFAFYRPETSSWTSAADAFLTGPVFNSSDDPQAYGMIVFPFPFMPSRLARAFTPTGINDNTNADAAAGASNTYDLGGYGRTFSAVRLSFDPGGGYTISFAGGRLYLYRRLCMVP